MKIMIAALSCCALLLVGCAATAYHPLKFDTQSSRYSTSTIIDPNAITARDVNVDLKKFKFVYLQTSSNVFPRRFEFYIRDVLHRAGLKNVVNTAELSAFILDNPKTQDIVSTSDTLAQRRIAEKVGPYLLVDIKSQWDGNVRRNVTLTIVDVSNGNTLLQINHPKLIWMNVDGEAHLPIFNELQSWADDTVGRRRKS
jgi:hypothetical protein